MKKIQSILVIALLCFAAIVKAETPDWSVNSSNFEFSMTLTATITIDGEPFGASNDMVGIFVGDECRGVATSTFVETYEKYYFFVTSFSNVHSGDSLRFRYYNASLDEEYELFNVEVFVDGKNLGTPSQPYKLSNTEVTGTSFNYNELDFSIYPNPATSLVTVKLGSKNINNVKVYNSIGAVVMENEERSNVVTINVSDLAKGIYIVTATSNNNSYSKKLVVK